jgi:hypothetical protein
MAQSPEVQNAPVPEAAPTKPQTVLTISNLQYTITELSRDELSLIFMGLDELPHGRVKELTAKLAQQASRVEAEAQTKVMQLMTPKTPTDTPAEN